MNDDELDGRLPEIQKINTTLVERALTLSSHIVDRPTLELAVAHGKEIDRRLAWWDSWISPTVAMAHKTWKSLTERREEIAAPLRRAKISLAGAIGYYKAEEEKKRAMEEAKLRADLQKKAEDEKLSVAATLESAGQKEAAEAVMEEPIIVPPVVLPGRAETNGSYTRESWEFTVTNESLIPRKFMEPNMKMIGQTVRALKDKTDIPGVEVRKRVSEVFKS